MYFFFNWRVVALQCCVDFCHTPTRISRRYWMSPPSLTSLPPPTLSQPSGLSQSTGFELSAPHRTFPPAVHFRTWQCTCSMLPPQFAHPSLPSARTLEPLFLAKGGTPWLSTIVYRNNWGRSKCVSALGILWSYADSYGKMDQDRDLKCPAIRRYCWQHWIVSQAMRVKYYLSPWSEMTSMKIL